MTTHPVSLAEYSEYQAMPEDIQAITETCHAYYVGAFTANGEAVRLVLHPEFVKRGIKFFEKRGKLDMSEIITADQMVNWAKEGAFSNMLESEKTFEITILDVFRDIANVKISSYTWMDYLFLARVDDRWVITLCQYQVRHGREIAPEL